MPKSETVLYVKILLSIAGTYAVLGSGLGTGWQTVLFLVVWGTTMLPLSRKEWIAFILVNLNFVVMDIQAFHKGFFVFNDPDWMGLPVWELFPWGYFAVLLIRLFPSDSKMPWHLLPLAMAFSLCFSLIQNQDWLIRASFAVLACMILLLGKRSLPIVAFAFFYGGMFETIGTGTDQWSYPQPNQLLGFPLWGISMWVGTGLIIACILNPLLSLFLSLNIILGLGRRSRRAICEMALV